MQIYAELIEIETCPRLVNKSGMTGRNFIYENIENFPQDYLNMKNCHEKPMSVCGSRIGIPFWLPSEEKQASRTKGETFTGTASGRQFLLLSLTSVQHIRPQSVI